MAMKLSVSEISQHNKRDDIWIVVNGKVYNMTKFAPGHPGGTEIIYRYAGRDATKEYAAVHPSSLIEKELHQSDYIGIVDESTITEDWKNLQTVAKVDIPADQYQKPLLDDILNLNDLEDVARHTLSAKSWAYIAGASNDNITRDANKSLLKKIWFRPAVMRNVESVNTRTRLFGCDLDLPIFIAPAGAAMHAGPDGELALARGAAATGIIQCIAITASYPLQEILDATPGGAFLQLYINKDKKRMEEIIRQATDSGKVKALLVTADLPAMSKREDYERVKPQVPVVTTNTDLEIPDSGSKRIGRNRQNGSFIDQTFNWNALTWLRSHTHLPIVIKGIQRSEDARIALQLGCQGIVVSNHGGRAADNAPPAILAMLELHKTCPEVFGAMEVLIDGGFRRGSDVVKAICLGASAVGFGRSFMYAVNYGQEGVEHAVNILKDEIEVTMRLCGMTDLMRDASPDYLNTAELDPLVFGGRHPYARKVAKVKASL